MQVGHAGGGLAPRGALLLACTQASIAGLSYPMLALDDEQAPRESVIRFRFSANPGALARCPAAYGRAGGGTCRRTRACHCEVPDRCDVVEPNVRVASVY
jgi:hypothetical protein